MNITSVTKVDFDRWTQIGQSLDHSPIRHHKEFGLGVFEKEGGIVVDPIEYVARQIARQEGTKPVGDK